MLDPEIIALAKKARKGDAEAFETLCDKKSENILFNAYGFLGNREDAEDVLQDVIIELHKNINRLNSIESVEAWILTVTRNKCLRLLRRRKKYDENTALDGDEAAIQIPDDDRDFIPEEYAENKELRAQLMEIIMKLSQKKREAIFMYYYDDMSMEEIARATGKNVNTITSTITRARQMIKEQLTQIEDKGKAMSGIASASILGGVLKEAAPIVFPPERIAAGRVHWVAAIAKARIAARAAVVVKAVVCVAIAVTTVTTVVYLNDTPAEQPTVSRIQGADVQDAIIFEGGTCDCGHIDPSAAGLAEQGPVIVNASWEVAYSASPGNILFEGEGTFVSTVFSELKTAGAAGDYLLTFRVKDADGNSYCVERVFEIS
ncbi:MAG: sigma-70 family RNA polymerase sigma factor [Clostridiales Family XIII bacterium]|jgi:RNA polymerase sigma factor (sigma-70 family)|nr:sigma-70 family RNA polymerase sigma factor [Clostridiales Family XIII bacterium]